MHYKDGTPAKLFDTIKTKVSYPAKEMTGILIDMTPGATSCNGLIQWVKAIPILKWNKETNKNELQHFYTSLTTECITLGEAELVHRDENVA